MSKIRAIHAHEIHDLIKMSPSTQHRSSIETMRITIALVFQSPKLDLSHTRTCSVETTSFLKASTSLPTLPSSSVSVGDHALVKDGVRVVHCRLVQVTDVDSFAKELLARSDQAATPDDDDDTLK